MDAVQSRLEAWRQAERAARAAERLVFARSMRADVAQADPAELAQAKAIRLQASKLLQSFLQEARSANAAFKQ